jgi:hypothetical protein
MVYTSLKEHQILNQTRAESIFGKHSRDRTPQYLAGVTMQEGGECFRFESSGVAGMPAVEFGTHFFPTHPQFIGIIYDHPAGGDAPRIKPRLILPAQEQCDFRCQTPKDFVGSVDFIFHLARI